MPASSPSPRSSRSISRELEAVGVLGERAQPRGGLRAEQQADRRVLAAPDAAAQLVQLADAVALGALDEHDRRVGDVDADLDHRRRDEHVGATGGERRHRRLLVLRAHLAVQERDAVVLQLAAAQALVLGGRGARRQRLGLLDERADDERLPAGVELLADALVRAGALGVGRGDVRRHGPAAARQLAQRRDVEVAVAQQRHRARDRRRGHVQDVRHQALLRLGVERRALAHAEAMLLVDDDDGEAVEAHVGLDERVRADDERQLAAGELVEDVGCAGRPASSRSAAPRGPTRRA